MHRRLAPIMATPYGTPGKPVVVVSPDARLVGSDGVAFDETGGLWIAVNHGDQLGAGALIRVDAAARLQVLASDPGWLDYPVQPAFGRGTGSSSLYVLNGSLMPGIPNVIALKVGTRGVRLP